ncbi:MAG: ATP-binding protein [Anaerolineales bacterium]|nr:ATP-binding protein [Anaerolineales bacterium]
MDAQVTAAPPIQRMQVGAILHLTSFVEHSPAPLAMFDGNLRCLAASQRWSQELHLDPKTLIGRAFFDCFPDPASREKWEKYLRRCLGGETLISENLATDAEHHVLKSPDGTVHWLEWELYPWHTEEQQIGGFVMLAQVFKCRLKNKRDRRLFDQLRKERNAANSASVSKSRFLASMSHEIRTPLNAIVGFSKLLQDDPQLTPKQADYIETIVRSSEHLLVLITNVLDYSKIEAGITELDLKPFEPKPLFEQIFKMFAVQVASEVELRLELGPETAGTVEGDEVKLRQILINLVGNAVKFTSKGYILLRAGIEAGPCNDWLQIEVEDTGIGIAQSDQQLVFEEFAQVGQRNQRGQGTGLGLPICRRLAKLMGGSLELKSQPDKGTTVSLTVPVKVASWISEQTGATARTRRRKASDPQLSSELREQLIEAANTADVETLEKLVELVSRADSKFADTLGSLVESFDYEAVISLVGRD